MNSNNSLVELLSKVPVFSRLNHQQLEPIAQVVVPRQFAANATIFKKDDTSDTCYIVRSGTARVISESSDGRVITLATFSSGDIFGELAMFDSETRSATVEAITELEVVAVLGSDMRRVMRAHPDIAIQLLSALGSRLREANERLSRQSFQTVQSRLASILMELIDERQETEPTALPLRIDYTQADLAKLAGSSRESASRFLAVLERANVIEQGRGYLNILEPESLRNYVF